MDKGRELGKRLIKALGGADYRSLKAALIRGVCTAYEKSESDDIDGAYLTALKAMRAFMVQLPKLPPNGSTFAFCVENIINYTAIRDLFGSTRKTPLDHLWQVYSEHLDSISYLIEKKLLVAQSIDHMTLLLAGTPFMPIMQSTIKLGLPEEQRFEGTWIVGPQGRGKTTLLSALLLEDLKKVREGKASIVVLDSKGDLVDHLKQYWEFAPGNPMGDKIVLIEPNEHLAINPLDLGTATNKIAMLESMFRALDTKATAKQLALLRSVLLAVSQIPNATVFTLREILTESGAWRKYEQDIKKSVEADFFLKGKFDSSDYRETRNEWDWRIQALVTQVPLLREMFKAPKTQLNIGEKMDEGKVIIIDNRVKLLEKEGSEFVGKFFLNLIRVAAEQRQERPDNQKLPCYVYADEFDVIGSRDDTVNTILSKCRSQKIAMILSHQKIADIENDRMKAGLFDCGIRLASPDEEASQLSGRMRAEVSMLQSLNRDKGEWALFIRGQTDAALKVSVENNPVKGWHKMPPQILRMMQGQMAEKYNYKPEQAAPVVEFEEPGPATTW